MLCKSLVICTVLLFDLLDTGHAGHLYRHRPHYIGRDIAPALSSSRSVNNTRLANEIDKIEAGLSHIGAEFLDFVKNIGSRLRRLEALLGVDGNASPSLHSELSLIPSLKAGEASPGFSAAVHASAQFSSEAHTTPAARLRSHLSHHRPWRDHVHPKVVNSFNPFRSLESQTRMTEHDGRIDTCTDSATAAKSRTMFRLPQPPPPGTTTSYRTTRTTRTIQTTITRSTSSRFTRSRSSTTTLTTTLYTTSTVTVTFPRVSSSESPSTSAKKTATITTRGHTSTFNPHATTNILAYYGQTPSTSATGLLDLCANHSAITIISLAFIPSFFGIDGLPSTSFGPGCTPFAGQPTTGLQNCTLLGKQIRDCQNIYGKKILVSLGGYIAQSSFATRESAIAFAKSLWDLFGDGAGAYSSPTLPSSKSATLRRPFGPDVRVDGFDIDNEDHRTAYWTDFAVALRSHFPPRATTPEQSSSGKTKQYYLAAAPQCPRPDESIPLAAMRLADFVSVQFYNNPACQLGAAGFVDSFAAWARDLSQGFGINSSSMGASTAPQVGSSGPRILLGVPAWSDGGSGYLSGPAIGDAIWKARKAAERYANFGGVMMWDASEAIANVDERTGETFVDYVARALR